MSEGLTDEELDEMAARAEAALPGPWEAFVEGRDHFGGDDFIRTGDLDDACPDVYVTLSYSNNEGPIPAGAEVLDFIAAARQDVPRLVGEVRRLRGLRPTHKQADGNPSPPERAAMSPEPSGSYVRNGGVRHPRR